MSKVRKALGFRQQALSTNLRCGSSNCKNSKVGVNSESKGLHSTHSSLMSKLFHLVTIEKLDLSPLKNEEDIF